MDRVLVVAVAAAGWSSAAETAGAWGIAVAVAVAVAVASVSDRESTTRVCSLPPLDGGSMAVGLRGCLRRTARSELDDDDDEDDE